MIRETELNLFVPSPELLVRLASGEKPLGIPAGPPRIRLLRETYFDTPDQALRRRGMTCKLRQTRSEQPTVVVTVGEGPDSEGITSRSRLTAAAIGAGVFETLRGDSEPAVIIRKSVDPSRLRPQIALDIQRLGRSVRRGILRRPVLDLYFDRISVQLGGTSTTLYEIRVRRQRRGKPLIRELGQALRDRYHLFPDGLSTLQRAYRLLAAEGRTPGPDLSPYALGLALTIFRNGLLALRRKGQTLCLPTFRGSGEDAARALVADILGPGEHPLQRVGTTEPRVGRPAMEIWAVPDPEVTEESLPRAGTFVWYPWHGLSQAIGRSDLCDPTLVSALLLLTRKRLQGHAPWIPRCSPGADGLPPSRAHSGTGLPPPPPSPEPDADLARRMEAVEALLPRLRNVEDRDAPLENRLVAASDLARALSSLFLEEVTAAKGEALSTAPESDSRHATRFMDLVTIRVRGIMDRLNASVMEDLLPVLEGADVSLRGWSRLMHRDRKALLQLLQDRYLPSMEVAPEWGPSFLPQMPPAGCAVGIFCRSPARDEVRFLHLILGPDTPSLLVVPGSTTVVPLEEVVRGFFFTRHPALERAETHFFRVTTGEATVREVIPPEVSSPVSSDAAPTPPEGVSTPEEAAQIRPDTVPTPAEGAPAPPDRVSAPDEGVSGPNEGVSVPDEGVSVPEEGVFVPEEAAPAAPNPAYTETRQSVVVRILVNQEMPERHQAQLLTALERQVGRRDPLLGWSDIYPVRGPLDLTGVDGLVHLMGFLRTARPAPSEEPR